MRSVLILIALLCLCTAERARAQQHPDSLQAKYEEEAIYWGQGLLLTLEGQRSVSATSFMTVRKGKYGPRLSTAEFYDVVGEAETASEYRLHNGLKWGLGAGLGGALVLGGLALFLVPMTGDDPRGAFSDTPRLAGAGSMIALGTVGILIAQFLDVDPHTLGDKRRMADRYNRDLRRRLSERAQDSVASSGAEGSDVNVHLAPTVSLDGLGLTLSGTF